MAGGLEQADRSVSRAEAFARQRNRRSRRLRALLAEPREHRHARWLVERMRRHGDAKQLAKAAEIG